MPVSRARVWVTEGDWIFPLPFTRGEDQSEGLIRRPFVSLTKREQGRSEGECESQLNGSALAVSMQSKVTLALTLTLSPRRGNRQWPRRKNSLNGESFPALEKVLPLPGGEGRGGGEREFQQPSSGLFFRASSFVIRHLPIRFKRRPA